jgi:integrase/recombinase XerD
MIIETVEKYKDPFPFIGPYRVCVDLSKNNPFPDEIPNIMLSINNLEDSIPGIVSDYTEVIDFLMTCCRKSEQTFNAFRTETERFMLWIWLVKKTTINTLRRSDINKYIDFCMKPPVNWVGVSRPRHFIEVLGEQVENELWKPFRVKESDFSPRAKFIKRKVSQATIERQFSVMSVFFNYLVEEDYCLGNPIPAVKKRCPYLINESEVPHIKRLSDDQWTQVVDILVKSANKNESYERNLFAIITLKSLYLRISEIASRNNWEPIMGHYFYDKEYLWLEVLGKGNKKRRVSVPSRYIPFLQRYRSYRGLSPMPVENEDTPLLSRTKGKAGLSIRQVTRIIEESFNLVVNELILKGMNQDAEEIKSASSHWLRHTGASQDAETRPLRHLADDLGHRSMATTDRSYVQSDVKARAKSGRDRKI